MSINKPQYQAIIQFSKEKVKTSSVLLEILKRISELKKIDILSNDKLFLAYNDLLNKKIIKKDIEIEKLLRTKKVRSLSGIVVVSVLTKPYKCPGKCIYCPTEKGLPKSYVKNEPAVMRAQLNHFDPYLQTFNRLKALKNAGHPTSKINIRIIGGTWSYYPKSYQTWFIKKCFKAANDFGRNFSNKFSLNHLQKINEKANCKIVEISIETRQDYINISEIKRLRNLGVTKVELGVQSIYDDVLILNKRGHLVNQTVIATRLLKDTGFKIAYQIMFNLPGSNLQRDYKMMKELFENHQFKPDYLKIYPLALIKNTDVYQLYKKKNFKPYSEKELLNLLIKVKKIIPPTVRIERVIRDIPSEQIVEGGAKISNLRQKLLSEISKQNIFCKCVRCREIKNFMNQKTKLIRRDYFSSEGKEIFLSIEDNNQKTLFSLLRLRIPSKPLLSVLKDAGIIREMHTYGYQLKVGTKQKDAAQHKGFGKKLLNEAEKIIKNEFNLSKSVTISGVGVRTYFRKLGYHLENTYMVKKLK